MKKPNTQMKKIMSTRARHVTFSKRRKGLFKKAYEISTLCDADVAVVVFSSAGNLFEYSSSNVNRLISMHNETSLKEPKAHETPGHSSSLEFKSIECHMLSKEMTSKINAIRHMKGENLQDLDVQDLNNLEDLIANSLKRVTGTKHQKIKEENELMKHDIPESSIPPNEAGNCHDYLQLRLAINDGW